MPQEDDDAVGDEECGTGIRQPSETYGTMDAQQDSARSGHVQFASRNNAEFRSRQLKAEVADTYALCSALLTGFCVCTIFIDHRSIDHERQSDPLRYYALIVHQVIVRLCTGLTLFSTLVFMLSTMYMKTALARRSYAFRVFDHFTNETATARQIGFWCMYSACILYMLSIAPVMFLSVPRSVACVLAAVVFVLTLVMWYHADRMVRSAGVIFMSEDKLAEAFGSCQVTARTPRSVASSARQSPQLTEHVEDSPGFWRHTSEG